MIRGALAAGAFASAVAFAPFAASDTEAFNAGVAAWDRGDYGQAAANLEKAVAADPKNAQALNLLGATYARQAAKANMFSAMSLANKAKDAWERAVQADPRYVAARMNLLEFYMAAPGVAGGSEEKARGQADEIRRIDAIDGHRAAARIHTFQKKPDLATKEMAEAVREQPGSAKAHYFLGAMLLAQKDWGGALREYDAALALDASYMRANYGLGQHAARSESNYARGEEAIRKYLAYKPASDEPGHGAAWYWLGMIQEKQGRRPDARQSYINAQKLAPDLEGVADAVKRVS